MFSCFKYGFIFFVLSKLVFAYENQSDFEKLNELEQKIEQTKNHINSMRMLQLKRQKELKAILMEYKSKNKKLNNLQYKTDLHSLDDRIEQRYLLGDHIYKFSSLDGENSLGLHALISVDNDVFMNYEGLTLNTGIRGVPIIDQNTVLRFWLNHVNPIVEGTFRKYFNFFINPDFGQSQQRLYDGFVSINYWRILGMRLGKQVSLVSGVENYGMSNIFHTLQPGFTTIMAPNRELGLVLFGSLGPYRIRNFNIFRTPFGFDDWLSYQLGIFSGTPDATNPGLNPINTQQFNSQKSSLSNKAFEGRVIFNPFLAYRDSILEPLAFGFAGSSQIVNNEDQFPGMVSPGINPIFVYKSNVYGNGPRSRLHPSVFWHINKFGVILEAAQTLQTLTPIAQTPKTKETLPNLIQINRAAQMQFVYNITSEKYRYLGMEPERDFNFFEKGANGAWQVVFQMSLLNMDPKVFDDFYINGAQKTYVYSDPRISVQHAQSMTFTLNWYWNKNFRISTEYDQTQYVGGCSTGALNSPITPGCLTAPSNYTTAIGSQVLNRPTEKLLVERILINF
jgi:phosphate-selective porin OprO/OprP